MEESRESPRSTGLSRRGFITATAAAGVLSAIGTSPAVADTTARSDMGSGAAVVPHVGIWYSTWYAKLPAIPQTWISGFGQGSANQFVADLDGDGFADAVTFEADGTWRVARSNGHGFNAPAIWARGLGTGSTEQFFADIDGDGRLEAVLYYDTDTTGDGATGDWYYAKVGAGSFGPEHLFASGLGAAADKRLLADVDGDDKADIVLFTASTGSWQVALSKGTSAGSARVWATGFGSSSANQFVADTTGDRKADAITFDGTTGDWFVAQSDGSSFGTPSAWTAGHGVGSVTQFVSDGNGDGYAEPSAFFNATLGIAGSNGTPGDLVVREYDRSIHAITNANEVFNGGFGANSTRYLQGNVTGDRYGWQASVAYYDDLDGGTWKVQRYHQSAAVTYDTWGAGFHPGRPLLYRPYTLGKYTTYDSGDSAVIDEHIAHITSAQIDYLLFDETNHLNVDSGYILNRARDVAERLALYNARLPKRQLKYAFVVGAIQYSGDPVSVEQEAAQVWAEFANDPRIGSSYFTLDGKPLLVVDASEAEREAWRNYTGDKSASSHFNIQWAGYPVAAGDYGWELPATGTVDDGDVMVAMPGWNNNVGNPPVSRDNGLFYSQDCIEPILQRNPRPKTVVINSFNEFAEETAVQTSDTNLVVAPTEKWTNTHGDLDPAMYWNMTRSFVAALKSGR